jgi:hypothetical protein
MYGGTYVINSKGRTMGKRYGNLGNMGKTLGASLGTIWNIKSNKNFKPHSPPKEEAGRKKMYLYGKENRRRLNLFKREANWKDGGTFKDKET